MCANKLAEVILALKRRHFFYHYYHKPPTHGLMVAAWNYSDDENDEVVKSWQQIPIETT